MYYALNDYLRTRFGRKIYKLALRGGMTCPTRDGTLGTRGCIFCSGHGAGEFAAPPEEISLQIERAKRLVASKAPDAGYIAYFQDFTNTYAPVQHLEQLFYPAIVHPEVVALSVATRPDCLPPPVLALLERLAKVKPVWVELGLQTIHAQTAQYIRRGYELDCYDHAVKALHAAGVEVVVHMILGLPGETPEMMEQTAAYIGRSGAEGIKLQLLHVLRGTDLAEAYFAGQVRVLTLPEYLALLARCIEVLPPQMVIHRLTGDGAKRDLLAPMWSADKKRVLNAVYAELQHVQQGARWMKEEEAWKSTV